MTYPEINGTLVSNNLMETFVYANTVTHNWFALFLVVGFFLVVLIGSLLAQFRFTTRIRPETSFLASCFATLGWATILEMYSGILNPIYFFFIIGCNILAFIWVINSD